MRRIRKRSAGSAPYLNRLVYLSSSPDPATWLAARTAGLLSAIHCPPRVLDRKAEIESLRPFLSSSTYPFRRP